MGRREQRRASQVVPQHSQAGAAGYGHDFRRRAADSAQGTECFRPPPPYPVYLEYLVYPG